MPLKNFDNVRACVFDAYGTLFDVGNTAKYIQEELFIWNANGKAFAELWRNKQLQYTWLRSLAGHHEDFWQVTADALDFAMKSFNIQDDSMRGRLLRLYLELPVYPDVEDTLQRLRKAGMRLAILSNGTPEMLRSVAVNNRIADHFDLMLSAEEVKTYKPHPSVYRLATEHLGIQASNICFISSNSWDAWSAKAFGYIVLWCNRYSSPPEHIPAPPDGVIRTLSELPGYFGAI